MPVREYVKHQMSRPRPSDGAPDLGAYERGTQVAVPTASRAGLRLSAHPNPTAGAVEIALVGPAAPGAGLLEVLDVRGRRVARLAPSAPGRWRWTPAPSERSGVYLVRIGSLVERITLLR